MNSLLSAITGVIDIVGSIPGMNTPVDGMPPEAINVFPFAVCYPYTGDMNVEATFGKDIHILKLLVLQNRSTLPTNVNSTATLYNSIRNAFVANPTLGGKVATIFAGRPLNYKYGAITYGNGQYLGYEFDIPCKILQG